MNVYSVPLAPAQAQRFSISLSEVQYRIALRWNTVLLIWIMDIADQYGKALANGIAVVAGADLVNQLTYLGFQGGLIAISTSVPDEPPSYDGLGVTDGIYYIPYNQGDNQSPYTREI